MSDTPLPTFEDPALRAALKRAVPAEAAPEALRRRIQALAGEGRAGEGGPTLRLVGGAEQGEGEPPKPIPMFRRGPLYKLAVAAVLVIGFGGLAYQVWKMNQPPQYDSATAIADATYAGMVQAHEAGVPASGRDVVAAAKSLAGQVNREVFGADLTKEGWALRGEAVVQVNGYTAGQLRFTKGGAAVSVLSLPSGAASGAPDGSSYEKDFQGSPIAGFVKGNGLFCIVGDKSLKLDEVRGLLERHKGEIVGG